MVLYFNGWPRLPGNRYIKLFVDVPAFLAYLQRLNAEYGDVMVMAGQAFKNDKGSKEQIELQEFCEHMTKAGKRYVSTQEIIRQISELEEFSLEVRILASKISVPRTRTTYVDCQKQKKEQKNLFQKLQHALESSDYHVPKSYISMRKCPPPQIYPKPFPTDTFAKMYTSKMQDWQFEEDDFARRYLEKNPESVFTRPMDLTSDSRPYLAEFARRWAELCRGGMDKTVAYKQVEQELSKKEEKEKLRNAAVPQTPTWVRVQQEEQKQLDRAMRKLDLAKRS
eukprot:TRINITY_DN233_c1_g1_i1.p1 TRINITY_DN233_c1_g1~~TRINITY_DN233_c1_g1_i1.p1  ORF type:complete len:281 (+),score=56.22 TRINITY_DN233_c1_g1_i1:55-897(+)